MRSDYSNWQAVDQFKPIYSQYKSTVGILDTFMNLLSSFACRFQVILCTRLNIFEIVIITVSGTLGKSILHICKSEFA
jgi:hypothetical protein